MDFFLFESRLVLMDVRLVGIALFERFLSTEPVGLFGTISIRV